MRRGNATRDACCLQAADDALERGEPSKISRLELQRRREMALTISQRLECARALHMPCPPPPPPHYCQPPVRYMTGLVNQSPADTSSHRPQPQRHASHDELGIRSCNAPCCCLSRANYPTQTAKPAPCARTHHTLYSCLPSSAAMPPTAPFSPCRARASSSRSASLASFPAQFCARFCIVRSVCPQDGLMDVLAASAERQKEIARAIAGELKEQDDVDSRR